MKLSTFVGGFPANYAFTMTVLAFVLFSGAVQALAQDCLPQAHINAILSKMEDSMARLKTQSDDDEYLGSGFLLKSSTGTYMITAHHVVHDAPVAPACESDSVRGVLNPLNLLPAQSKFGILSFSTRAPDISVDDDLVRSPMPARLNLKLNGLEAESSLRPPQLEEKIIVAGFPDAKGRKYMRHECRFQGYTQSLNSETVPAYALDCDIDYDIAAMSGGVAISACTGKVIGALSAQEFEQSCGNTGTPRFVQIAPVSINPEGQILFGVQHTAQTNCIYTDPMTTQPDVVRACTIGSRNFPPLVR